MYSYKVTDDFKVEVYNDLGEIIDNPGPWQNAEEAESWASAFVGALNDGTIPWPPTPPRVEEEVTEE